MSDTIVYSTVLTQTSCGGCGIPFAIPKNLFDARYADGGKFYCPNGHCIGWTTPEADRLRAQLDQAQADANRQRRLKEAAQEARDFQARRAAAARGHLTRIKNRIVNGVCPVPGCKRSGFDNVRDHIASVHPDYHAHEDKT